MADQHIQNGSIDRALDLLTNCPPQFRNWEWGRLMYLCHQDLLSFQAHTKVTSYFEWQGKAMQGMAFSPDGLFLVTHGHDGTLKASRTENGAALFTFGNSSNAVTSWAFRPDGLQLAAATTDGAVALIDTRTWRQSAVQSFLISTEPQGRARHSVRAESGSVKDGAQRTDAPYQTQDDLRGSRREEALKSEIRNLKSEIQITHLAYSPDSTKLAVATDRRRITVHDTASGKNLYTLPPSVTPLNGVDFSPDGRRLKTIEPTVVVVWDSATGRPIERLATPAEENEPNLSVDPPGRNFVTVDSANRIKLWRHGQSALTLSTLGLRGYALTSVSWSRDGSLFCTSGLNGNARVWRTDSGKELFPLKDDVDSAQFSPDNSLLLTLSSDKVARLWELPAGRLRMVLRGHAAPIESAVINHDGTRIATGDREGVVKLWRTSLGREMLTREDHKTIWPVAYSPNGKLVAAPVWGGPIKVWDADSGRLLHRLSAPFHSAMSWGFGFSSDSRRLETGGTDRTARVWDMETGSNIMVLRGHTQILNTVAMSADDRFIATSAQDKTVRVWDAATGRQLYVFDHPRVVGLHYRSFHPDSKRMLTDCEDGYVRQWSLESGQLISKFLVPGSVNVGQSADYSPDGSRIYVTFGNRSLWIYDSQSGALVSEMKGRAPFQNFQVSPDGGRLAIATYETEGIGGSFSTVEILDAADGREVLSLPGHEESGVWSMFQPQGRRLVSSSFDGTVRQWETFPWRETDYPGAASMPFAERIEHYASNYWRERLVAEKAIVNEPPKEEKSAWSRADRSLWPRRPALTSPRQLDLTEHYNGLLDLVVIPYGNPWLGGDNHLGALPAGVTNWAGTEFDVRGVIQLRPGPTDPLMETVWKLLPTQAAAIRVGQRFHRLHAIVGAASNSTYGNESAEDGRVIGAFVLHYADGTSRECEISYGHHVRHWWVKNDTNDKTDLAQIVWAGQNPNTKLYGTSLRLYKSVWENPRPEVEVTSIDFVSKLSRLAPFVVAMTVEE